MNVNWLATLIAALVPLMLGFVWYHEKLFGNAWMQSIGLTKDNAKNMNMGKVFGITFLVSFIFAFGLNFSVIHQNSAQGLFMVNNTPPDPASAEGQYMAEFFAKFAGKHRTWTHGLVHGMIIGLFSILPAVVVNGLFERRNWKNILINSGFWILCTMIMGAIICGWM